MKNVFDIKKEQNLNFILAQDTSPKNFSRNNFMGKVLVVVHLYYEDTVERYCPYLKSIPEYIDVLFTTSSEVVNKKIAYCMQDRKNRYKIVQKKNRGRDMSALLVAAREEILNYEYVCFLHDKKAKAQYSRADTEKWIDSLWNSMLASENYVEHLLQVLCERDDLGILVPAAPFGEDISSAYGDAWLGNFENTVELAKEFGLNCDLDKAKNPITLGTVFWAKTASLKKLLMKEWVYEDFDAEPMADNKTISHAIERILAYVAQDAGYVTGEVMTERLASERMIYAEEVISVAMALLRENMGIVNIRNARTWETTRQNMLSFCQTKKKIYIYGAGVRGTDCLAMARFLGIAVEGFLVTEKKNRKADVQGVAVYELSAVQLQEDVGVLVAVVPKTVPAVLSGIKERFPKFENILVWPQEV